MELARSLSTRSVDTFLFLSGIFLWVSNSLLRGLDGGFGRSYGALHRYTCVIFTCAHGHGGTKML